MSFPNTGEVESDNCPHQIFTKAVRTLHTRRNAPPPIPIPVNPISSIIQVIPAEQLPQTSPWVAVELSNYPPQLTRHDVHVLFKGFNISPDFALPNTTRLAYPLRTFIWVAGEQEAERAARDLSGKVMGGRQIYVAIKEEASFEQKEGVVAELADELKIGIINTARVYYPHLASKIFEVRERIQGPSYFAFLQARDLVTIHSEPEAHLQPMQNMAKWELVAAGRSDGRSNGRLSALKDLQETMEAQGVLKKMWEQWNGSQLLDMIDSHCGKM